MSRPALASMIALALSACSGIENDPDRFESMARAVAAIDVPMTPVSRDAPSVPALATAAQSGLRPALQVQVMDPHDLWDARDGGVENAVRQAVVRTAVDAAPVVTQAVVR
ncbi:MAG: hypothetical protein J0M36_10580, partial [Caulobacterales bacterium]|nr:hypothetical protein [Caulobacterales bacterium]